MVDVFFSKISSCERLVVLRLSPVLFCFGLHLQLGWVDSTISNMLLLPPSIASASRRSRGPSIAVLLATAIACLPQAVRGFGLSGIGVRHAVNGELVPRASAAAALERTVGREGQQQARKWRERAHEITCRVQSPRRYGSAVSVD